MDKDTEIAEYAYFIWLRAGCPEGNAFEHWLQAEAELAAKSPPVTTSVSEAAVISKKQSNRSAKGIEKQSRAETAALSRSNN